MSFVSFFFSVGVIQILGTYLILQIKEVKQDIGEDGYLMEVAPLLKYLSKKYGIIKNI